MNEFKRWPFFGSMFFSDYRILSKWPPPLVVECITFDNQNIQNKTKIPYDNPFYVCVYHFYTAELIPPNE